MARKFFTDIDMQSASKITNLPDATQPGDAVRFSQLNAAVEGLAWKDSCRVSTQGNLSIASPGATIDGVTMATQDRVLVRSQTAGAENGIYIWNGAAVAMTRALDASTFEELEQAVVTVEEGSSTGSTFRQTAVNGTLGTTTVAWATFGTSAPAASETTSGIAELATQAETDAGTDDLRIVTPAKLANWSGRIKKFSTNIGDGSALTYTVTHGLNSRDVIVRVFPNSGQYDDVEVDVQRTSTTVVTLVFVAAPSAPAANAYRVVVIG
jgi:hypothetical protein